jgi:hypothetical protein
MDTKPLVKEWVNFKDSASELRNKFTRNEGTQKDTVERLVGKFIGAAASLALTGLTTLCKVLCKFAKNLWDIIKSACQQKGVEITM